jgi:hypothetical protein
MKKTICCFITKKLEDDIVSIGVEKLNRTNKSDSPKKKKNIQNDNRKYEVNLDVNDVNWYLCLKDLYHRLFLF